MTQEEALKESRQRWGAKAFVLEKPEWAPRGLDKVVGVVERNRQVIKGTGPTFQQAIKFADKIYSLIVG